MTDVLKPGAVVRLRSGGPVMTVRCEASARGFVHADWFEGHTLHTACFAAEQLDSAAESHTLEKPNAPV